MIRNFVTVICTVLMVFSTIQLNAQGKDQKHKVIVGGFYNLENLFDTEDDTLILDEEFLPTGTRAWTEDLYKEKLANMAYTIGQIGISDVSAGLSFLGVSEVENRKVLEDLVQQSFIANRNYQIIHYDSPDRRGVDVAFLYNPSHFHPISSKAYPLILFDGDERRYTRDILYVKGTIETDTFHILVNHWSSRGGGEAKTAPARNKGAALCRTVIDSLRSINPKVKCIVMGDLNDDPTNDSLKKHLRAVSNIKDVKKTGMFNPFEDMYRRGMGSNAYRDAWSLFDQIIISEGLALKDNDGYYYYKANIFNKNYLIQKKGKYKGYPMRTFDGDTYQGGYSDHFPTYIYFVKKID
ncbi:MAG: endonuclease/exonuclease/phosphatase family protein [Saprospiraceae bacterium]